MDKRGVNMQKCLSIIIVSLLFFFNYNSAAEPICKTEERSNQIININETKKVLGDAVRVLRAIKLDNIEQCKAECCKTSECTLYTSSIRSGTKPNCFLVECLPKESCVLSPQFGFTVGIRELNEDYFEDSRGSSNKNNNITTVQPSTNTTTKALELEATTLPTTSANTTAASEKTESSTSPGIQEKHSKDDKNHTTVASLVIALFFGIVFLFAVMLLIGRPWWDFFHRPRYSKVDYLMNGL